MQDSRNLKKHELIGLRAQVISSPDPTHVGRVGMVVDETRQTFVIDTDSGERRFPKMNSVFRFFLENENVDLDGNSITFRPEDRPKKVK